MPPVALEPVIVEAPDEEHAVVETPEPAPASRSTSTLASASASVPSPRPLARALITPPTPLPIPGQRPASNAHPAPSHRPNGRPADAGAGPAHHDDEHGERGATGPQLRRFIKSRAYVPMHELRRRFVINGGDDDVTSVDLGERRRVFVGLPEREGHLLGELLRGGDIGYELSLDPISPIVVGVYPMRPVTRA